MATRAKNPSKTETSGKQSARTRRLRSPQPGALTVRPRGTVGGGRAIGQQNKLTRDVKRDVMEVFIGLGSVKAMIKWAKANQSDFYTKIYTRLIPRDVTLGASEGLEAMLLKLSEQQSSGDVVDADYELVGESK